MADFEYGYKTIFEKLESLYIDCGRRILGAHPCSSHTAILVRLGWLPLEYRLALNAVMWCLRTLNNKAGPTLSAFYSSIKTRPHLVSRTATIQPAINFVSHLNNFYDGNLFDIPLTRVKSALQEAMFAELTTYWNTFDSCKILHSVHNDWQPRRLSSNIFSRITTSCYHSFACGYGYLNSWRHHIGICTTPDCRHGCKKSETAEHILLHCPFYDKERFLITDICNSLGLRITVGTFLTDHRLHRRVEQLLHKFLNQDA